MIGKTDIPDIREGTVREGRHSANELRGAASRGIIKLPMSRPPPLVPEAHTMEQVEAVSHYKTNLRDIEFNLFEVLGRDEVLGTGPFGEIDGESAREILREVERLSREDLAASYEDSDRNPPVFDPATHTAPVPESFKASYQAWMDSEFWRLQVFEEMGGTPAPSSLIWAIGEMVLGANAPVWMYAAGPAFANVVHRNGNERDKQVAAATWSTASGAAPWC